MHLKKNINGWQVQRFGPDELDSSSYLTYRQSDFTSRNDSTIVIFLIL
jgi:hypothetical protein